MLRGKGVSKQVDPGMVAGGRRQTPVACHQRRIEDFGECHGLGSYHFGGRPKIPSPWFRSLSISTPDRGVETWVGDLQIKDTFSRP